MGDRSDESRHRHEEALKLCLDGCKHMSTLSAIAAGILVAIYREDVVGSVPLAIALIMLTLSIITSFMGLLSSTLRFVIGGGLEFPFVLLFFSIDLFAIGVLGVVAEVLHLPAWAAIAAGSIAGAAILAPVLFPLLYGSKAAPPGE